MTLEALDLLSVALEMNKVLNTSGDLATKPCRFDIVG